MPSFSTEVPHSLGQEAALERLKGLIETMRSQFEEQVNNLEGTWNGNQLSYSFETFGFSIAGVVTILEQVARVEGQIPFAVMPFRGAIEEQIRSELEKAFS